ncbi:MAG TPA: DUF402 domain-containing protein [Tepidisphaeraceae bacterium]|nr:DUF402 domain-containing protein [Tepidisphaeraceae bacterium]
MDELLVHSTKYDGSLHYRYPLQLVQRTEGRLITFTAPGVPVESYRGSWAGEKHFLHLFWRGRPYVLHVRWNSHWQPEMLYVDIAAETDWTDRVVRYIDMDLDVILRHGKTDPELEDEDEFHAHRTRWRYPEELVRTCWAAVEDVRALLARNKEPFGPSMFAWRPGMALRF